MKKSSYLLTPNAKNDLRGIWNYTFDIWGEQQAEEYLFEFFKRFSWLADQPFVGTHRPEVRQGYYSFLHAEHVVFYEIINNDIVIIGIPNQSMDIDLFFD
ncbi:type II toxin-antitoxin system RelE/ParE family toxin [Glaciecola sp. 1036]|uniref:type II toxin-antitoxin system RelE/ParE family toxin n=1 Tax=Alteromonadaceae TaxID=72275 RepID=UPI003D083113